MEVLKTEYCPGSRFRSGPWQEGWNGDYFGQLGGNQGHDHSDRGNGHPHVGRDHTSGFIRDPGEYPAVHCNRVVQRWNHSGHNAYHTLELIFGQCGDDRECAERGRSGNNSWGRDNVNRSECQRSDRLNHHDRAVNRLMNGQGDVRRGAINRERSPDIYRRPGLSPNFLSGPTR